MHKQKTLKYQMPHDIVNLAGKFQSQLFWLNFWEVIRDTICFIFVFSLGNNYFHDQNLIHAYLISPLKRSLVIILILSSKNDKKLKTVRILSKNYTFSISYESFPNITECSVLKFELLSLVTQKLLQGIIPV